MHILKAVVIGMAVLIVLGIGLLVYGLVQRSVNGDVADDVPAERSMVPAFGDITLPLGDGCSIADMAVEDGRLYIRSGPGGDCAGVYVLDAATGALVGSVRAAP